MAIRFENIKEFIGSRVLWDDRADLFTPEAAAAIRAKTGANLEYALSFTVTRKNIDEFTRTTSGAV